MTKAEFLNEMASQMGCSVKKADEAYDAFLATVTKCLKDEKQVNLYGFGTFRIAETKERTGINPQTKEKITIAPKTAIRFKASASLKKEF